MNFEKPPLVTTRWNHHAIHQPGLYSHLPIDAYHNERGEVTAGPSISASGLRAIFRESPAHYWATSMLNPDRQDAPPESAALTLGRAAHHLLLSQDDFSTQFIVRPEKWTDWKLAAAREWRDHQRGQGLTVLTMEDLHLIRGMARALAAHPLVKHGILSGKIEQSAVWRDPETGVWLKCRPDAVPTSAGDYGDLKTTASVLTDALERSIPEFGYHQQAAMIREGMNFLGGPPMETYSLVFVEKKPPHCVRVVALREADLERGRKQNRAAVRIFAHCWAKKNWPGPGFETDAEYIGIPSWEAKKIDERIEFIEREYLPREAR